MSQDPDSDLTQTAITRGAQAGAAQAAMLGTIGNYRLIRKLGQGGMGMVFEAEQQDPKRLVALKVISEGIFAAENSIKLFEREVLALARLKHPGIAAIYEAGQTAEGRRFFTMELVSGETLNAYLASHALSRPQLLRLFLSICDAVTYAHQRGVIHRDLKPSNIMVQEHEGVATVKVLDFGLARIADEDLTYVTEAGTVRGTLPYMSPEQVRGNPDEIDLRTDVYALGVVLFEALTGRLPHEFGKVSVHEAARIICEDPPARLEDAIRPRANADEDLCTIVHKAIEADISRRYTNVSALADDIQRYLTNQPIQGRPPSTVYQMRKLVARHRLAFGFAATVLVLLIVFAVAVSLQARRIARERDRANQEAETARQVSSFLTRLFSISNPNTSRGNAVTARELLEQGKSKIAGELKNQPAVRASLLASMGSAYNGLGLYPEARQLSAEALDLRRQVFGPRSLEVANTIHEMAAIAYNQADWAGAINYDRQALELYRSVLPAGDPRIAAAMHSLGDSLGANGQFKEAVPLLRESLERARQIDGPDGPATAEATQRLGMNLLKARDYAGAEPLLREAIRIYERREGETSTFVASTLNDLGSLLSMTGDLAGAEAAYRRCRAAAAKIFGPDHPNVAIIDQNLAVNLRRQHRYPEAEALTREATARFVKALGPEHPRYSVFLEGLGDILRDRGDMAGAGAIYRRGLEFDQLHAKRHLGVSYVRMGDWLTRTGHPEQGEPLLRQGLAEFEKTTPQGSPEMAEYQRQLGECLAKLRRLPESEEVLLRSFDMLHKTLGDTHPQTRESAAALAATYELSGKPAEAARFRAIQHASGGRGQ